LTYSNTDSDDVFGHVLFARRFEHCSKLVDAHACLLGADVLYAEAEDSRELRKVVDVSARLEQREHVAPADRVALLLAQAEARAVRFFVVEERLAIRGLVERIAHLGERIALERELAVEDVCARDIASACHAHESGARDHAPLLLGVRIGSRCEAATASSRR